MAGIIDGEPSNARAVGAGALLGLAATMRTESFVYAAATVGCCCVLLVVSKRVRRAVTTGALTVAGFAVPWLANMALEAWVSGNERSARVSGPVSSGRSDEHTSEPQ